jgi:hypothetical protein
VRNLKETEDFCTTSQPSSPKHDHSIAVKLVSLGSDRTEFNARCFRTGRFCILFILKGARTYAGIAMTSGR